MAMFVFICSYVYIYVCVCVCIIKEKCLCVCMSAYDRHDSSVNGIRSLKFSRRYRIIMRYVTPSVIEICPRHWFRSAVFLSNEMTGLSGSNFIAMFTIVVLLSSRYVPRPKKKFGIGHTIQFKKCD